jgi:hypothetical protein
MYRISQVGEVQKYPTRALAHPPLNKGSFGEGYTLFTCKVLYLKKYKLAVVMPEANAPWIVDVHCVWRQLIIVLNYELRITNYELVKAAFEKVYQQHEEN